MNFTTTTIFSLRALTMLIILHALVSYFFSKFRKGFFENFFKNKYSVVVTAIIFLGVFPTINILNFETDLTQRLLGLSLVFNLIFVYLLYKKKREIIQNQDPSPAPKVA